jgi:hypothetical protein
LVEKLDAHTLPVLLDPRRARKQGIRAGAMHHGESRGFSRCIVNKEELFRLGRSNKIGDPVMSAFGHAYLTPKLTVPSGNQWLL